MKTVLKLHEARYKIPYEMAKERFSNLVKRYLSVTIHEVQNNFAQMAVSDVSDQVLTNAGYANRYLNPIYTYNCLFYGHQLKYAWFLYTTNPDKPVSFTIADRQLELIGKFRKDGIGSYIVMKGIQAALLLRDQQALAFYADIPLSFTGQANQEDIIFETMLIFYQVLLKGTGTIHTAQATYQELSKVLSWEEYKRYVIKEGFNQDWVWQIVFQMRKQTAEYIFIPVLNIYNQVLHNNQAGYEVAVTQALEQWQAYYTLRYQEHGEEQDHSTEPDGYLSLPIAAACAYAYDRGFRLAKLESDYIPDWLIEGRFENMELLGKE